MYLLCGIDNLTQNHQWLGVWLQQVCFRVSLRLSNLAIYCIAASELNRLGPGSIAVLATDHEPTRYKVRQALGDRFAPSSNLHDCITSAASVHFNLVPRVFWQEGNISHRSSSAAHTAFVDMWLLGDTASIVTTCGSTFGYVAHARTNIKPITITLDSAEAVHMNTSEPCLHAWPLLLDAECFRGTFQSAMATFGHRNCRPWDMCVSK